jgi:cold shock CspA family protein
MTLGHRDEILAYESDIVRAFESLMERLSGDHRLVVDARRSRFWARLGRRLRPPMVGRIVRLTNEGWGYISDAPLPVRDQNEYFFHRSALLDTQFQSLREGQRVEFELEDSRQGPRATNIFVLN